MTSDGFSLIISPTNPVIRFRVADDGLFIERPDLKESVRIPTDQIEMFVMMLTDEINGVEDDREPALAPDDDGDDDDDPADGESFDGGFGPGSYFNHSMRKDS